MSLTPGQQVLHRYVVERLLGEGAMGEVYKGRHMMLEKAVALKVLKPIEGIGLLDRFDREARLMARVEHPNVVRVLDYGVLHEKSPCIVMEFIEGEPLDALLERDGALPWPRAVEVVQALLSGLGALHAQGIIHRDVKTSNVMMTRAGEVKLTDLGIARPTDPSTTRLTGTGLLIGTPAYMAPELLVGEVASVATDHYAAAMMLYELVTGDLPLDGGTARGVMRRLREEPTPAVAPLDRPALPGALVTLLADALRLDAPKRLSDLPAALAGLHQQTRAAAASLASAPTVSAPTMRPPTTPAAAILRPGRRRPEHAPTDQLPNMASPGETAAYMLDEATVRAVVVARLPVSRLLDRQERKALEGLLGGSGKAMVFGAQHWVALLRAYTHEEAAARALALIEELEGRFGSLARAAWAPTPDGWTLHAAHMSGAEPLPEPLHELVTSV